MKKLLSLVLSLSLVATLSASADEVRRDANGKIIGTTTKNPGGSETVRDAAGKIVEQKTTEAAAPGTRGGRRMGEHGGTTAVRDTNGKIIRTETKR